MDAGVTQIGWVMWNGDEFHGFIYSAPDDDPDRFHAYIPVYVEKPEGFDPRED